MILISLTAKKKGKVNARAIMNERGTRAQVQRIRNLQPSTNINTLAITATTIMSTAADELAGFTNQASR
jgi:hypothetical protein